MPRKQTPEEEYDPIKAEVARNVARRERGPELVRLDTDSRGAPSGEPTTSRASEESPAGAVVIELPRTKTVARREGTQPPQRTPRREPARNLADDNEREQTTTLQRRLIFKHFKVTEDEDLDLLAFVQRLQQKARSKVTFSTIARALFHLAMHAEEEVMAELAKGPQMPRPGNEDEAKLAEYEELWIQRLSAALRKSRPPQVGLPRRRQE